MPCRALYCLRKKIKNQSSNIKNQRLKNQKLKVEIKNYSQETKKKCYLCNAREMKGNAEERPRTALVRFGKLGIRVLNLGALFFLITFFSDKKLPLIMKNMKFNQIKNKMEKYFIIKESLGTISTVCRVYYRENAKLYAELLNEKSKENGSDDRYYVFELTED